MTTERQRIVVGVDGSEGGRAALEWAIEEATRRDDEVEAVFAFDSGLAWIDVGSDEQARIVEHATTQARALLADALAHVLSHPCPVTVHSMVVQGSPAAVLIEVARTADLLVVGSRGRGGFAGLLLGSVSQRCAEHASCPVVVVPSAAGA
jgi:nucleotide-binding universal stress UspA family protein